MPMKKEALAAAKAAYEIECECLREMLAYFDDEAFANAVTLLKNAPRIGASGCGHSGIICQHFAHLMCCIEQPAKCIELDRVFESQGVDYSECYERYVSYDKLLNN